MSEQEKFETQGRAHAALKTAKSNVATLTVALREFSLAMRSLSREVDNLIANPEGGESGALMPQSQNLGEHLKRLNVEGAVLQIVDLCQEARRVRLLEEEIAKF